MKPGAPGTWDRAMHRALQSIGLPGFIRTGRARWNLEAPIQWHGFKITPGKLHKPYGRSTHTGARLAHMTHGVLLVWKNGRLVGSQAIWKCRTKTLHFELSDTPVGKPCVMCRVRKDAEDESSRS